LCVRLGLYGKELAALDGSKFKAVNSRRRSFTEKQIQKKIVDITKKIEEYLKELDINDEHENTIKSEKTTEDIN